MAVGQISIYSSPECILKGWPSHCSDLQNSILHVLLEKVTRNSSRSVTAHIVFTVKSLFYYILDTSKSSGFGWLASTAIDSSRWSSPGVIYVC